MRMRQQCGVLDAFLGVYKCYRDGMAEITIVGLLLELQGESFLGACYYATEVCNGEAYKHFFDGAMDNSRFGPNYKCEFFEQVGTVGMAP